MERKMLTSVERENLEKQLQSWTDSGRTFTAFDVTVEVSKKTGYVPHSLARPVIHSYMEDLMSDGCYTRRVDPARNNANLYEPVAVPVKQKVVVVDNKGNAASISTVTCSGPSCSSNPNHKLLGTVRTSAYTGRVNLTQDMVKSLGNTVRYVRAVKVNDTLIVRPESSSHSGKRGVYCVDGHDNVKINASLLGLPGNKYQVYKGNSNELILRKAS